MKAYGSIAVGGDPGAHVPLTTAPYGAEYERLVARNVGANEGVRRMRRAVTDALEGRGTKPAPAKRPGPRPGGQPRVSEQDVPRVVAWYAAGEPATVIAARLGVHPDTCRAVLRRAGVSLRVGGASPAGVGLRRPDVLAAVVAEYVGGEGLGSIAARRGVSRHLVTSALRSAGVTIRPRGANAPGGAS